MGLGDMSLGRRDSLDKATAVTVPGHLIITWWIGPSLVGDAAL